MASVRQRRSVSVSARAGLIQNQEEAEEEEEDFMDTGVLDTISQRYESLDYFTNFNSLLLDEIRRRGYKFVTRTVSEYILVTIHTCDDNLCYQDVQRWIIMLLIGILTALIGCSIVITIEIFADYKYALLREWTDHCVQERHDCLYIPYLLWVTLNVVPTVIGSFLIAYIEPVAGGSGIPQIKCYLNGVKVPNVVRIKTLLCKAVGVVCSVLGGLAVGKEGPMIHSGAVVAVSVLINQHQ